MFKPEKMLSTSILLLEDDVNSISRLLAAQACFHLTDQRLVLANETLQKRNQDSELADQCRRYANLADVLLKRIDLHAVKISPAQKAKILSQDSGKLLEQSETVLTLIQKEIVY